MHRLPACLLLSGALLAGTSHASMVTLTIDNLAPDAGLSFTPVFVGFHDGSFDLFDSGSPASPGLESIAEVGDPALLASEFAAAAPAGQSAVIANPEGPGGVIFNPGASETATFYLDPMEHRYLSFASMLVPSNDTFFGLGDPMAIELFDGLGNLQPGVWSFSAMMSYDAGTEANDPLDGGAFVMGVNGAEGTATDGVVMMQSAGSLADLLGITIPPGTQIGTTGGTVLRIEIAPIPEPGVVGPLAGLALFLPLILGRRRR